MRSDSPAARLGFSRLTIPEFAPTETGATRRWGTWRKPASRFLNSRRLKQDMYKQHIQEFYRLTIPEFAPTETAGPSPPCAMTAPPHDS